MYHVLFDLVLRHLDPERAHALAFGAIRAAARVPGLHQLIEHLLGCREVVDVHGRAVPGRLGVAAGFDKDARGVLGLTMLGFAFVEVGTVTAQAQPGNEPPRLWRELRIHALRNRMGFNNEGARAVAQRLRRLRSSRRGRAAVVGVNIGKSRATPLAQAADDYATSAGLLAPYADYLVVNVSSPNTPGLRELQAVDALRPVLTAARAAADAATGPTRHVPLLVKIAPDLSDDEVDAIADLVGELGLDGVVAVNTTLVHDLGPGGLSGPPLLERGVQVVARLRARLGAGPVIMGVGGIVTAADARRYLAAGATLLQGYTAFIYEGPFWAGRLHRGLTGATGTA